MKTGVELIAAERQKQIDKHGFTAEHHAQHPEWYEERQLLQAAAALLFPELGEEFIDGMPKNWDYSWFNNLMGRAHEDRIVIAGALIAAELDRINFKNDKEKRKDPDPVTIIDTKEFLELRQKAEKWDKLDEEIGKCYGDYDPINDKELPSEYQEEHGSEPDLSTIGEIAASAFGYF